MKSEKILGVVGHLAVNETRVALGIGEYYGGAAYHVAFGAGVVGGGRTELISRCGGDFDLAALRRLGIGLSRVGVEKKELSDRFIISERGEGRGRGFEAVGNMAGRVRVDGADLKGIGWVHLATAPPEQQRRWLDVAWVVGAKVSVDSFELFVRKEPGLVKQMFADADLVFVNEDEWEAVGMRFPDLKGDVVLKRGGNGAEYYKAGELIARVPAARVNVVDTTGAGEILAGTFLRLRLNGWEVREALGKACMLASWSTTDFGVDHLLNRIEAVKIGG